MFDNFGEKMELVRERFAGSREIPFENGIKLVSTVRNKQPEVLFKQGQEVLLDLKSFAPDGTQIKVSPKNKWAAYLGSENTPPEILMGKFSDATAILDFLHEAGHLHDVVGTDLSLTAERYYMQHFFNVEPDLQHPDPEQLLALQNRRDAALTAEKTAWKFSVENMRIIEERLGISITQYLGGVTAVNEHVSNALKIYERIYMTELEHIGFDVYTPQQMTELFSTISTAH